MQMHLLPVLAMLVVPAAFAAQDGGGSVASDHADASANPLAGMQLAQLTIHERIVVRIPRVAPRVDGRTLERAPQPRWTEKKAPQCVAIAMLTGAAVSGDGDVDLIVNDGRRLRAKLGDDCPALDFYSGFYLKPTSDGRLCADRDAIRSRSGATCPIDRFRTLVAKR